VDIFGVFYRYQCTKVDNFLNSRPLLENNDSFGIRLEREQGYKTDQLRLVLCFKATLK